MPDIGEKRRKELESLPKEFQCELEELDKKLKSLQEKLIISSFSSAEEKKEVIEKMKEITAEMQKLFPKYSK